MLSARFGMLGYPYPWVILEQTDDGRIKARIPVEMEREYVEVVKRPGLVEFVDFGKNPPEVGNRVNTDFETGEGADNENIWHTLMAGTEIQKEKITSHTNGIYEVEITLKENGSDILADYSSTGSGRWEEPPCTAKKAAWPISPPRMKMPSSTNCAGCSPICHPITSPRRR
jgi:hypothetical protein